MSLFVFTISSGFAQSKHYITSGVIEFEKKDNMFALLKKKVTPVSMDNKQYYDKYLQTEPQFVTFNSTLVFGDNKTLFTPVPPAKPLFWFYDSPIISQINIVFNDFANGTRTIQKEFYEVSYLVKDTLRKIKWKLTDETRVIAGFDCRRANGLVMDSIYAVAFYTDDIHVSGGPESFNGLPGMILGVSLPHENVTWWATKVTESRPDSKIVVAPKKGRLVNSKELYDELYRARAKNGEIGFYFIKGLML